MWTEKDMVGRIREEEPKKEEKKTENEDVPVEVVIDEIVETIKQIVEEEAPVEETVTETVEEKTEEEPVEISEDKDEGRTYVVSVEEKTEEITRHVAPTIVKEERKEKTEEVMPCPFCGASVKLTFYKKWHVTGHETSCILAPSFNTGKTKEQMLAAWNRRV